MGKFLSATQASISKQIKFVHLKRSQRCFRVCLSLVSSTKWQEKNQAHQKVEVQLCAVGEPIAKQLHDRVPLVFGLVRITMYYVPSLSYKIQSKFFKRSKFPKWDLGGIKYWRFAQNTLSETKIQNLHP